MATNQHVDAKRVIDGWDQLFAALSAEPRRQIIVSLLEAPPDRQLSLPEAANPPYALMDPEQLYVELVHSHLPVLADGDYVEWDSEPLRVERGPNFEEAAVVFQALHDTASDIPDRLVHGCQRLEEKRGKEMTDRESSSTLRRRWPGPRVSDHTNWTTPSTNTSKRMHWPNSPRWTTPTGG